jgi:hypothetical protein
MIIPIQLQFMRHYGEPDYVLNHKFSISSAATAAPITKMYRLCYNPLQREAGWNLISESEEIGKVEMESD